VSDDGRNTVIRPLIYCAESELARYAEERAFPILPCNLCGSQTNAQRKQMKSMLAAMEAEHPKLKQSMLAALGNVVPSHLLDVTLTSGLSAARTAPDPTLDPALPETVSDAVVAGRRRLPLAAD
jgi:tRNA 2-thiocytidine biosynthesis protein TtcA